jgi:hypothetical protein
MGKNRRGSMQVLRCGVLSSRFQVRGSESYGKVGHDSSETPQGETGDIRSQCIPLPSLFQGQSLSHSGVSRGREGGN